MVTITPENWQATKNLGVTVQGFTSKQRKKVERMVNGDRLLFYIKDQRLFAAATSVVSNALEDKSPIWTSAHPQEVFPHRVRLKGDWVMPEGQELDAALIAPRLEYIKRWPPEMWPLALQGELHILPRVDYEVIEGEMMRLLKPQAMRTAPTPNRREFQAMRRARGFFRPQQNQQQPAPAPINLGQAPVGPGPAGNQAPAAGTGIASNSS